VHQITRASGFFVGRVFRKTLLVIRVLTNVSSAQVVFGLSLQPAIVVLAREHKSAVQQFFELTRSFSKEF